MSRSKSLPAGVEMTFRPAAVEDLAWCYRVYADGMQAHVERAFGWDDEDQQRKFVSVFRPQEARIIRGRIGSTVAEVGWIQVEAEADDLHVKELHIVRGSRSLGLGAWALMQVVREAAAVGKDVRLAALEASPAVRFYLGLGFRVTGADGGVVRLRRRRDG